MLTYWILLAFAGFMTWLSIRRYHFVFSLAGMLAWFAMWGYHLTDPPTGITAGTWVYDLLYYAYVIMALAILLIYIAGRTSRKTTASLSVEDGKIVAQSSMTENVPEDRIDAYRNRVRTALNPNRRKR